MSIAQKHSIVCVLNCIFIETIELGFFLDQASERNTRSVEKNYI